MKDKFKYFIYEGWAYDQGLRLVIANEEGCYYINREGNTWSNRGFERDKNRNVHFSKQNYTEVSLKEALKLVNPDAKDKIYELLKIPKIDVVITEEIKNNILQELKNNRALNEDSAMEFNNEKDDICLELVEQGTIKQYDGRYFVVDN